MSSDNGNAPSDSKPPHQWDPDMVYAVLGDPARRRLLFLLAQGGPKRGLDLKVGGRQLGGTLKYLAALCETGLVEKMPNPQDGRQPLYRLSPAVTLKTTSEGLMMLFGFCQSQVVTVAAGPSTRWPHTDKRVR